MSLSSDMQTLLLENARLQVQVEKAKNEKLVAALEDAKAKIAALEDEKRLSARKPESQALQPAPPTSSSDHALRAENAQLQTMIAQRDEQISALVGMVGGLDKEVRQFFTGLVKVSGDLESNRTERFDKAPERLSLLIPDILRESTTKTTVNEHESRTESKASASVTDTDNSKEPSNPRPIPVAVPDKRGPIWAAFFGSGEKWGRVGSIFPSQTVGAPEIPASTTASDKEPNVATGRNSAASSFVVSEASGMYPPSTFRWADIRNPSTKILCMVQANTDTLIGSFAEDTEDWAFQLTFDAGRRRSPTLSMRFFSNGLFCGQIGWCLGDYIESDWMVTAFNTHRVADCLEDEDKGVRYRRQRDRVLAACETDEEKARLICIYLEAWPGIKGSWSRADLQRNPQPGVKKFFSKVFTGDRPYQLRIWFVAPEDMEGFEMHCLSFFTRYFEQRNVHHDDLYDVDGISFTDHLNAQKEYSSS